MEEIMQNIKISQLNPVKDENIEQRNNKCNKYRELGHRF
jgi:hypothetical protein